MKFTNNADLTRAFVEYITFERTLVDSIPGGEPWDIAESLVLTECDCLITLEEKPSSNQDPLFSPLEFGVEDIFSAFETLMERRNKIGATYPVNYFTYDKLLIMYVGDYSTISARFAKYHKQTATYYAEEMYKRMSETPSEAPTESAEDNKPQE